MFVSGRNQKPIICVIPICSQLFLVAGFVFDITAHNVIAVWTGSTLSVVVGSFFFRETIREKLFATNYPISRRWLLILEDEGHALAYQACSRFMIIPLFVDIPSWKISLACAFITPRGFQFSLHQLAIQCRTLSPSRRHGGRLRRILRDGLSWLH